MGSDWVADITANDWRLDNLAYRSTGYDVQVWVEEEDASPRFYFWSSPHLDVSDDVKIVQNRAAALRALWNGVLFVHYPNYTPLRLSVLRGERGRIADFELGDANSEPFAPEVLAKGRRRLSRWENPLEDNVELCIALARHDLGARHRLQALGVAGVTMPTLFLLHEDMLKIGKWTNDDIDRYGEATIPVAQRFQATVNNPTDSGPQSRHGGPGTRPSKAAPATLAEARPVILRAYGRYLLKRADEIGLANLV